MKKKIQILMVCLLVALQCFSGSVQFAKVEVMAAQTASKATTIKIKAGKKTDITKKVNDAMTKARRKATASKPYKIVIPKGTYYISGPICLCSNVTLEATGATIKFRGKAKSLNMLLTDTVDKKSTAKTKGYKGCKNITISGGTYVGAKNNKGNLVKMAHGKNITIKNATFSGGGGLHQVEVCAINGFTVTGCTFKSFKARQGKGEEAKQEALQLDIPVAESVFAETYQDGTVMKNVLISGNTFQDVPRGLGTHTMLVGRFHENVMITNNKFQNVHEEAIVTTSYYNCEIADNNFTNCGAGILVQSFKSKTSSIYAKAKSQAGKSQNYKEIRTRIHDNVIQTKNDPMCDRVQGIAVIGHLLEKTQTGASNQKIAKGDYRASNVSIYNNNITTEGHGIHLAGVKNVMVEINMIIGKGKTGVMDNKNDGIAIRDCSQQVVVKNNTISKSSRCGIMVFENSNVKELSANQISKVGECGIRVYGESSVTNAIQNNHIQGAGSIGISIACRSQAGVVVGNIVSQTENDGISLYDGSVISGNVEKNTITAAGGNGIMLNSKCTVGSIQANTLSNVTGAGIKLYAQSEVKDSIGKNQITGCQGREILVGKDCKVKDLVQ